MTMAPVVAVLAGVGGAELIRLIWRVVPDKWRKTA
jgi:hypothetical protein